MTIFSNSNSSGLWNHRKPETKMTSIIIQMFTKCAQHCSQYTILHFDHMLYLVAYFLQLNVNVTSFCTRARKPLKTEETYFFKTPKLCYALMSLHRVRWIGYSKWKVPGSPPDHGNDFLLNFNHYLGKINTIFSNSNSSGLWNHRKPETKNEKRNYSNVHLCP